MRHLIAALGAGLAITTSALGAIEVAGVSVLDTVAVRDRVLERAICGVRSTLWIEHYVAALYLPTGSAGQLARQLVDPAVPKVVTLNVLTTRFMPVELPREWRAPLERTLPPDALERVREAYRSLERGDVATILYDPEGGVVMLQNGRTVVTAPGHAVIDAVLAAWAKSESLVRKVGELRERHPCRLPA